MKNKKCHVRHSRRPNGACTQKRFAVHAYKYAAKWVKRPGPTLVNLRKIRLKKPIEWLPNLLGTFMSK